MTRAGRWAAGAAVIVVVAVIVVTIAERSSSDSAQRDVVDLTAEGRPLRGHPIDLIGVRDAYVGLVEAGSRTWAVTSDDGVHWDAHHVDELPGDAALNAGYPGGLNNVRHVLFTDGGAVYLRSRTDTSYDRLGTVSLYVSDATAKSWQPIVLPVPVGKGAFPIAAAEADGRRYLAGAVFDPVYGRSYLDAAVWISDDGGDWRLVDAPALTGDGNQTIFALDVAGTTVIAGGGDGALVHTDTCCFYPDGIALWRSTDAGVSWIRSATADGPYTLFDHGAVVGFVEDGTALHADAPSSPPRSVVSADRGASWTITTYPNGDTGGVAFPSPSRVLRVDGHYVATTVPSEFCSDCVQGALARSDDGIRWWDVTPRLPCGDHDRASYDFVSAPVAIGNELAVLGGCGGPLSAFDETFAAISTDRGSTWNIERFDGPTGGPIAAVGGQGRIVTLAGGPFGEPAKQVRAVILHG